MNYPYCEDSVMYGRKQGGPNGDVAVRTGTRGGTFFGTASLLRPAVVCGALLFGAGASGAQDAARAQMMQKYLQQQSTGSSSQMQDLMRKYRAGELEGQDGTRPESGRTEMVRDEAGLEDTVVHERVESVYEAIVRGRSIHPDDILDSIAVFGMDVFAKAKTSTFAPTDNVPVPSSYPIVSGDEVIVMLWGRINEEYRLKVDRDGKINIPRLGPVPVAGLTLSSMRENLLDRLGNIEGVKASVTMGELRPVQIYVVGEVKSPGLYTVGALSNITNALFAAGGPTADGSLRTIELRRNGRRVRTVDFYEFLNEGKNYTSVRLRPGDVISVPVVPRMAAIAGNVRRSALYEIMPETGLKDLVSLSGGFTPAAWVNRIQVERFTDNRYQCVLDFEAESADRLPDVAVEDGDIVKVFPVVVRDMNAVYLSGNVVRPGKYEYEEGDRVSDVLTDYTSLLSETYFDYAIVKRKEAPSFHESVIPFDLSAAIENKGGADDLELRPWDEIVVYHRDYFEPDRSVSAQGALTRPGNYKLMENMTIRDLLIEAGGLREDASPEHGELYRRNVEGETVITTKIDFCVECAMEDDPRHNLGLQKLDRVFVRTRKGWEEEKRVHLTGEFSFPGEYVVLEDETLGEIIERAGGFTPEAYLAAAVFSRVSVRQRERQRMQEYATEMERNILQLSGELAVTDNPEEAQAVLEQQQAVAQQLRTAQPVGRVVLDLTNPASYAGFVMEDGDSLYVPRDLSTVSVVGEVYNPSTFKLDGAGRTAGHYIQLAGGFKERADKKNVYIVKANGSIRTRKMTDVSKEKLRPGDAVIVPQKLRYVSASKVFAETISTLVNVTAIFTSIATLILVAR